MKYTFHSTRRCLSILGLLILGSHSVAFCQMDTTVSDIRSYYNTSESIDSVFLKIDSTVCFSVTLLNKIPRFIKKILKEDSSESIFFSRKRSIDYLNVRKLSLFEECSGFWLVGYEEPGWVGGTIFYLIKYSGKEVEAFHKFHIASQNINYFELRVKMLAGQYTVQ